MGLGLPTVDLKLLKCFQGGSNIDIRLCPCDEVVTMPQPPTTSTTATTTAASGNNNNNNDTNNEVTERPGKYYYFKLL